MTKNDLTELAEKITSGIASDEELLLYNRLCNSLLPLTEDEVQIKAITDIGTEIKSAVDKRIAPVKQGHRIRFWRLSAAAAAIMVLLGAASYLLFVKKDVTSETTHQPANAFPQKDIAPGKDGAILTLADGKTVILENIGNGELTGQAVKQDNLLSYEKASVKDIEYNIVSTPIGRQFSLLLADGSKVWLNAASSLRFPTAFAGKERTVELTGEGYFEVAHNASKPFHVIVNNMDVQVLGTHFNVMAYVNEEAIKTTLLQGSVKVKNNSAVKILLPGEQAQANGSIGIKVDKNADVEAAVAWKNGKFQFGEKAEITMIMRQLARWYDVEVNYKGGVKGHIGGSISRNVNLSQVLTMLEKTGAVKFETEGRKITVIPVQ